MIIGSWVFTQAAVFIGLELIICVSIRSAWTRDFFVPLITSCVFNLSQVVFIDVDLLNVDGFLVLLFQFAKNYQGRKTTY